MPKVKGWVREDENTWNLKISDGNTKKTIIIQEGSNRIIFIDWDRGKRKYAFPPTRRKAEMYVKNWIKRHPRG